ncbi:MAG: hypothetical protein C0469_00060 [Cyanobacteria bacterium DS2.3.42]|nr:hypothetical protein [Cyanobacteria bacterium DS2.3.42]
MRPREPMTRLQGFISFLLMMLLGAGLLKGLMNPAEILWQVFWNSQGALDALMKVIITYVLFVLAAFALALIVLGLFGFATTIAGKPDALPEALAKFKGHTKRKG